MTTVLSSHSSDLKQEATNQSRNGSATVFINPITALFSTNDLAENHDISLSPWISRKSSLIQDNESEGISADDHLSMLRTARLASQSSHSIISKIDVANQNIELEHTAETRIKSPEYTQSPVIESNQTFEAVTETSARGKPKKRTITRKSSIITPETQVKQAIAPEITTEKRRETSMKTQTPNSSSRRSVSIMDSALTPKRRKSILPKISISADNLSTNPVTTKVQRVEEPTVPEPEMMNTETDEPTAPAVEPAEIYNLPPIMPRRESIRFFEDEAPAQRKSTAPRKQKPPVTSIKQLSILDIGKTLTLCDNMLASKPVVWMHGFMQKHNEVDETERPKTAAEAFQSISLPTPRRLRTADTVSNVPKLSIANNETVAPLNIPPTITASVAVPPLKREVLKQRISSAVERIDGVLHSGDSVPVLHSGLQSRAKLHLYRAKTSGRFTEPEVISKIKEDAKVKHHTMFLGDEEAVSINNLVYYTNGCLTKGGKDGQRPASKTISTKPVSKASKVVSCTTALGLDEFSDPANNTGWEHSDQEETTKESWNQSGRIHMVAPMISSSKCIPLVANRMELPAPHRKSKAVKGKNKKVTKAASVPSSSNIKLPPTKGNPSIETNASKHIKSLLKKRRRRAKSPASPIHNLRQSEVAIQNIDVPLTTVRPSKTLPTKDAVHSHTHSRPQTTKTIESTDQRISLIQASQFPIGIMTLAPVASTCVLPTEPSEMDLVSEIGSIPTSLFSKSNFADYSSVAMSLDESRGIVSELSTPISTVNTSIFGTKCESSIDRASPTPSIIFSEEGHVGNLEQPTPWRTRQSTALPHQVKQRSDGNPAKEAKAVEKSRPPKQASRLANSFAFALIQNSSDTNQDQVEAVRIKLPFKKHVKMEPWLTLWLEHSFIIYQSVRRIQRVWRRALFRRHLMMKFIAVKTIQR
ncbi:hypothetical protein BCR33DRAFT_723190 [Rhizoclosmatium globosum]|uniref:Uncharacterized protein n=1 Tax=Rhizoclosmatium globosum TaxID=329046 RepID=A0A1Y2BFN7_9FUNG|nr:hypothetical protein BCR33DRAFT_723190 [Rhizoclosmatium globosum]|eukprot:ORY33628.1 hypothetical protein BCR33DRAFT_723190 [Rhizoclosmatium globosum]